MLFILEPCCLVIINYKTIHTCIGDPLASGTSVPFGPPFVSKCISLAQCSIVYFCYFLSHLDTIKDYVIIFMLCYVIDLHAYYCRLHNLCQNAVELWSSC